jgi:ribonuclease R
MNELAHIIRKERNIRGAIDFDTDEAKILVDENCHPTQIVLRDRGEGEKLIEDFMVRANETVASHFFHMDLPSVYRVHGEPAEERLIKFLNIVSSLGINVKGDIKKMSPKTIQHLVNDLKKYPQFKVLSTKLLSCMDKAIYSPDNIGHFALASKIYTHFTSPIRRYPDLMIHRLLDTYFFSKDGITDEKTRHYLEILPDITLHASERERASEECERDVDDMKMAEYMEEHLGEEYIGMISGVTNFGFFVMLDNMVEGLVPVESLGNNYTFDKNTEILKVDNKLYKLGDKVSVKVTRSDKASCEIDFILAERSEENEEKEVKKKD